MTRTHQIRRPLRTLRTRAAGNILALAMLGAGSTSAVATELRPAPLAAPTNLQADQWGSMTYLRWKDNSTSEWGHMVQHYYNASLSPDSLSWTWKTIATLPANSTVYGDDIDSLCGKIRVVAYRWVYSNGEWKMEQKASSSIQVQCPGPDH